MKRLSRNQSARSISPSKNTTHLKHLYFCHFKNGMYMGSMDCYQKHGLGIVLHDNGTSMLSSYSNDMLHGDNVAFFPNGSCMSARYSKDKLTELVYKNRDVIFYSHYKNNYPDGGAILIRLREEVVEYLNYKNGAILAKSIEQDHVRLTRIFIQKSYEDLIPREHILNLELDGPMHEGISVCKKSGKILVGFTKEDYMINGLGFVLLIKNEPFSDVQVLERGYYKNSQLSGFGQRNFKNGNNYIGEFKYDQFEGVGVLKNIHKHNWVSGNFERGSLVELLTYGSEEDEKAANKVLESIHQGKMSWMNKQIGVPSQFPVEKQILMIAREKSNFDDRILEKKQIDVLRRIQDNFITSTDDMSGEISSSGSRKLSIVHQKDLKQSKQSRQSKQSQNSSIHNSSIHNHQDSYSFIKQNQPQLSSSSRRNVFEISGQSSKNKSSFRLDVKPVPMDTPKQIQSRLLIKPSFKKPSVLKPIETKSPLKNQKSTKALNSENKNSNRSISRSKSVSNVNAIKLIDSMYKKNTKNKLF